MTAYYNENDRFAAAWLRNLIAAGVIAPGDVDERSIEDVLPVELNGYAQCHLSAFYDNMQRAQRNARREGYTIERRALPKKPGQIGRPPVLYVLVKISS